MEHGIAGYDVGRNVPGEDRTSMLSPHMHWGELSPAQAWHAALGTPAGEGRERYLSELLWHEFSAHSLWHSPHVPDASQRAQFDRLAWRDDPAGLRAWQLGQTGVPVVDAGMRQLWQTGWMHNRVRMITASFLVKHLLVDWRTGEQWFWDTLVDGDLAVNAQSWQWVAGSGVDSQPFHRVFNPVTQGERFDAAGHYVRRWVPELAALPDKHIHAPWQAPAEILAAAGIVLAKPTRGRWWAWMRGGTGRCRPTEPCGMQHDPDGPAAAGGGGRPRGLPRLRVRRGDRPVHRAARRPDR